MGDNIVLRFQYSGKDTDVVVGDIDKINLIDLIMDYWERCEKENNPFPKNPIFSYIYKMKQVDVYTDAHLMKMFNDFSGRDLIYIWVSESRKPTTVVESATKLRELLEHATRSVDPTVVVEPTNHAVEPTNPAVEPINPAEPINQAHNEPIAPVKTCVVTKPLKPVVKPSKKGLRSTDVVLITKEDFYANPPIHSTPIQTSEPPVIQSQISQTPHNTFRAIDCHVDNPVSPSHIDELISDNMDYWTNIHVTPVEPNVGNGRGRVKLRGSGRGKGRGRGGSVGGGVSNQDQTMGITTENQQIEQPIQQHSQMNTSEIGECSKEAQSSPLFKKRMAKTTARRKGLWHPRVLLNMNDTLQTQEETVDLNVDGDFGNSDSEPRVNHSTDSESMSEDTTVEDEVGHVSSEADNNTDGLNPPYIHDDYDPYQEECLADDYEDNFDDEDDVNEGERIMGHTRCTFN